MRLRDFQLHKEVREFVKECCYLCGYRLPPGERISGTRQIHDDTQIVMTRLLPERLQSSGSHFLVPFFEDNND